jgi:uncharacterized protein YfaP (DUF2135 family)
MNKLKTLVVPLSATLLIACGGGGDGGTAPFQDGGKGTSPFGGGAGTSFQDGAGTSPFGSGSGGSVSQAGDGPRPAADPTVVVSAAAVYGEVFSADTGAAVNGATVAFGTVSLSTDASGFFSQATYSPTNRLVQRASMTGFEDVYLPTTVLAAISSVSQFKLTLGGNASPLAGPGGVVSESSGPGRVSFPPNSLQDAAGLPSANAVAVRFTSVGLGSDSYLLSGDYTSSTNEPLEAFGAAVLSNAGNLQIDPTIAAVVRIPVSTRTASPPTSANLYYLDPATATWVQEGTANLVANDPAGAYYEGSVTRFAQWMVGQPLVSPVMVRGCVQDDAGVLVPNVRMVAEGVSYSGLAYVYTDSTGHFAAPVKVHSDLIVSGRRGAVLTNAASTKTETSDVTLGACLTLPSSNAATVRLTWGASPRDIDSHLLVPGGAHVYYPDSQRGSLDAEPFANLDVDDTTSFGPEMTTIRRPKTGIYRFYLHNFSGESNPGMTQSPTRVELSYLGRTVVFSPPTGEGANRYWHVFDIEVGANCSMTLYRYNRFRPDQPANPNVSTAGAACVP